MSDYLDDRAVIGKRLIDDLYDAAGSGYAADALADLLIAAGYRWRCKVPYYLLGRCGWLNVGTATACDNCGAPRPA